MHNDRARAPPEPDAQTELHPLRAIPGNPLNLAKQKQGSVSDKPFKAREEPRLETLLDCEELRWRQISR